MVVQKIQISEEGRLKELHSYEILDTPPEKAFDDVTLLASQICKVPIAYISLIDGERQWFKSTLGVNIKETKREHSICSDAIKKPSEITIIEDVRENELYYNHPFVKSGLGLVFYASCPLVTHNNIAIGTICVMDKKPRKLSLKEKEALQALSRQVINALEFRKLRNKLTKNYQLVKAKNNLLDEFAKNTINHISSPLNAIDMSLEMLKKTSSFSQDETIKKYTSIIKGSTQKMIGLIDEMKAIHHDLDVLTHEKEKFNVNKVLKNLLIQYKLDARITLVLPVEAPYMFENRVLFETVCRILLELSINVAFDTILDIHLFFKPHKEYYLLKFRDNYSVRFSTPKILETNSVQDSLNVIRAFSKASGWKIEYHFDEHSGNSVDILIPKR